MEPNRLWHEPEVIVYGNLITPGTCCSAEAYDLANRKWYQLNVDSEVDDDEWMSKFIEDHIAKYYRKHRRMPSFNVINTTREGNPTSLDSKPDDIVARPITEKLFYNTNPPSPIIVTPFDLLMDKVYISRGVDRCLWRGRDCIFKRIEFDVDVMSIDREIKTREKLLGAMKYNSNDKESVMEQQFNVIPIVAIVVKPGGDGEVLGILMPFSGLSLESLFNSMPNVPSSSTQSTGIVITRGQLRDLVCGVRELARAGVVHGDINARNTLLKPHIPGSGEICQAVQRLVMIDLGTLAPEYKSDAFALGQLFILCKEYSSWDAVDQRRVEIAARTLQETEDFDRALNDMDKTWENVHEDTLYNIKT